MTDKYASLQDIMKPLDAVRLMTLFYAMGVSSVERGDYSLFGLAFHPTSEQREEFQCKFTEFQQECKRLNLDVSAGMVARAIEELPSVTYHQFGILCENLHQCLIEELRPRIVLCIDPNELELFRAENPFGNKVAEAFPSAREDIKNAARCLALDCWPASVMHCMRVLEVGLNTLAKRLNVVCNRPDWGNLINKIETEIERNRGANKVEDQFNTDAALQFRYFKDAWRNHAMHKHENENFDEKRAELIYRHVEEFMAHLATRLKEDAP
jgi:hypothetical protein